MRIKARQTVLDPGTHQTLEGRPPSRGRRSRRLLAAAACGLLALTGCQSISGNTVVSQVRIIDASPDAPGIDIYEGTAPVAYNLGFGNVTSYIEINPGTYTLTADSTGTRQVLTSAAGTFAASSQYTMLVSNVAASLQETILKDQSSSAPGGDVAFRFLDEGTAVGAVDIYLVPSGSAITAVAPILSNVTFGSNSGYLNVLAGAYKIVVFPTGTVPTATTVAAYTGAVVTYNSGSARTIVLLDQKLLSSPSVQVLTADDYDSPSATS
jgi:hypothetical protein